MSSDGKELTRRSFLGKNIRAAACLAAAGTLGSQEVWSAGAKRKKTKKKSRKSGPMRFGFTTYTWGKPWDIPTLIVNCTKAKALGVELRTSQKYAHGVELTLPAAQRREVKTQFANSPITLVGLASGERFDSPDPAKVKTAIEAAKAHMKLSHDIGGTGVRVFPNDFHEGVAHEVTIAQIAKALNEVGAYAAGLGQQVRLEAHGNVGHLPFIGQIMAQVDQPSVRVKLNSDARDAEGDGFKKNFRKVKRYLGDTLHVHDMKNDKFPHQLQMDVLMNMGWDGWWLVEASDKVPDRVQALVEQRKMWETFFKNSLKKQQA
ncbi:MAG: TIM barrel protein [Planctomycetes bacterium]|nr:TIM barrel protein [Planctomycetota bacterium]